MRIRLQRLSPWILGLGLLGPGLTLAHNPLLLTGDPFGGLVVAELQPTTLELRITLVHSVGLALATHDSLTSFDFSTTFIPTTLPLQPASANTSAMPAVADQDFMQARPALLQRAASLYQVFADGTPLRPRLTEVLLTPENDIEFHLTYPLPASHTLRFQGDYLSKMPAAHKDTLLVFDASGNPLANVELTPQNPSLDLTLPVSSSSGQKMLHISLGVIILLVIIFGLRYLSRAKPSDVS